MFEWFARRRREREAYLSALNTLVTSNAKTVEMVMAAVEKITATQSKQLEAITTHLELFKTVEPPTASSMSGSEDNRAWAEQAGFPFEGTPEEQHRWILEHDTDD